MLAISIRGLRENDRWRTLRDERRRPFPTWEDFCQHPEPWGLELSPEQVEAILERSNAGKRLSAVLGEHGGDRGNQHTGGKRQGAAAPCSRGTNSNEYWRGRLARDRPDVLAQLEAGEFKSARQAAIAIELKKTPAPLEELKRWWGRASDCDRAQFEDYQDAWHRELYRPSGWRSWRSFCAHFSPEEPERIDVLIRALEVLESRGEKRDFGEAEAQRLAGWGGDRRSVRARADQGDNITLKTKRGTDPTYLEARLEKLAREGMPRKGIPPVAEAAELLRRVRAKEMSAHAAAKAVGIVSKLDALQRLRAAWHGASPEQRRTFLAEISGHEEDAA
jgi:hypothetical protein